MRFHINPETGNANQCRASKSCPFGGEEEHFASKEEARGAYEARMAQATLSVPHDKAETMETGKGNTYSKVTEQTDGSLAQTINGHVVVIGVEEDGVRAVSMEGKHIGSVAWDRKRKVWTITRPNGRSAREQKFPVDALSVLVASARLKRDSGPVKGYAPLRSELDPYEDFPTHKSMTTANLRRLDDEDLVRVYNRVAGDNHRASYSDEMIRSASAMKRILGVLQERGRTVAMASFPTLQDGEDHVGVETYRLA